MNNTKSVADAFIILSALAFIFSAVVALFKMDLWLAGTQWMLVAIVFAIYAIFIKIKAGE